MSETKSHVKPVGVRKNRLTTNLVVHHESLLDDPRSFQSISARLLSSQEQEYTRVQSVGGDWKSLDLGWLEDNWGYFLFQNLEGRDRMINPTQEERKETESRVLEVSLAASRDESWLVPPGMFFFGLPAKAESISVRCAVDHPLRFKLVVFPR